MDIWTIAGIVSLIIVLLFMFSGKKISGAEAKQKVSAGALLVDVRTPVEFNGGHIDGAVNIPLSQVDSRIDDFGERDKPIILYCASGARSGVVLRKLKKHGFSDAHNLGSISRWG